jgi:hypothetical protein
MVVLLNEMMGINKLWNFNFMINLKLGELDFNRNIDFIRLLLRKTV